MATSAEKLEMIIASTIRGLMRDAQNYDRWASDPMQADILREAYAELAASNRSVAAKIDARRYDTARNTATR